MDSKEDEASEEFQRYQENENIPLSTNEVIDNINTKIRKKQEKNKNNYLSELIYFLIIILFLLFFIYFLKNNPDVENDNFLYLNLNDSTKEYFNTNKIDNNIQKNNKAIGVAFLHDSLFGNGISRFMVVTGEYFVRKGFNVYFILKPPPYSKDFKFNEKIKVLYIYDCGSLIKNATKTQQIDFLILNNVFDKGMIDEYKSFGVKIIGIYHGVYISPMFNNYLEMFPMWKNLDLYDAYIHLSPDDYYFYKHFGFKRNIFIPNFNTFDPSNVPSSNLTNNNLMMLGRLNDKKKGVVYAIKAMELIVKEIPDAKLYLISSDSRVYQFTNLTQELNITNNVIFSYYVENISEYFLNSSIFFFTSITEAFPMALNEAKAYGLPCVTFDIDYSMPYRNGVIKVEMFNYKELAKEVIKLLKDYNYRIKMGREAKISLNNFNNEITTNLWGRLFNALLNGEDEFQKLRQEIETKYYNEEIAEKHLEKQLNYLKMYNKFFRCHSLQNFSNLDYINNIKECENVNRRRRRR